MNCSNGETCFYIEDIVNCDDSRPRDRVDLYHAGKSHTSKMKESLQKKVMRRKDYKMTVEDLTVNGACELGNSLPPKKKQYF